jgi:hypothetical protein
MTAFYSPSTNQDVTGPREGKGLACRGYWVEEEEVDDGRDGGLHRTRKVPQANASLILVLAQPGVPNQSLTTTTGMEGDWDGRFSRCRPGAATLTATNTAGGVLTKVTFNVAANQRAAIVVTLDNAQDADPAADAEGARIKVPVGGAMVTVNAKIASPTHHIEVQTSLDSYTSTTQLAFNGEPGWSKPFSVAGRQAPAHPVLLVRDFDFFGDPRESSYHFTLDDITPPNIQIQEPTEDQELYLPSQQSTVDVIVRGTVNDADQSGYQAGTLRYTFNGQTTPVEPDAAGSFVFVISAGLGPNRIVMRALDVAGNQTPDVTREFVIASNYKPKTVEELLGERSYLADLIRFATSHVLDPDGHDMSTALLSETFMPITGGNVSDFFGALADPGSMLGDKMLNELLPAVYRLRKKPMGLLVRFPFETEQGQETPDAGPLRLHAVLSKAGMIGAQGTPTDGALQVSGHDYAMSGGTATDVLMDLGKGNADFSVSFWIWLSAGSSGDWRSVLFKGHQGSEFSDVVSNRTFGIWLHQDSNQVHYRVSTVNDFNEGGDSNAQLREQRWTHVCYVKRRSLLELYIDGTKDSWVQLSGDLVPNSDPLYMGANPSYSSFEGALDDVRVYGFALSKDDIGILSTDRGAPITVDGPLRTYLRAAYEALLIANGTSYEELRALPARGTTARRAIAERLGLTSPNALDDGLDPLLAPATQGDAFVEEWLTGTFGFPGTADILDVTLNAGWQGWLLSARQDYLARSWQAADANPPTSTRPRLDPDFVERADLNPDHREATNALAARKAQLELEWASLRSAANVGAEIALVYSTSEIAHLPQIEALDVSGASIDALLPPLGLSMRGFRRLRFYQGLQAPLSEREKDDLAHLLTQAWKTRTKYSTWANEERTFTASLWPSNLGKGAFVEGNYRRDFPPWRAEVSHRLRFEDEVSGRHSAFDALAAAQDRAVLDAQRAALPLVRDGLLSISELPSASEAMDGMTDVLLLDVAATGALTRTLIEQATLTLQDLINGLRLGRFEFGHPATNWRLRVRWLDAPTDDSDLAHFDEEWSAMGSYGSWRYAKRLYFYPESALYPELRTKDTTPYSLTDPFSTFLGELRKLAPDVPDAAWMTAHASPVTTTYEREFFVPVAIGVMLERASLHSLALDWYRKVYQTRLPANERAQVGVLTDENGKNKPPTVRYDDRWALEIDPHTNARRTDVVNGQVQRRFGNPYTRFVLARTVRCHVGLADAAFARGDDEGRTAALALYLEGKHILQFPELEDLPPANASQAYLPNPDLDALRDHIAVSLRKLRRGLSYLGTPAQTDQLHTADGISPLLRPTPYRFRVLMDRAKQLVSVTQNLEAQYLAALEKRDSEDEKYRREAAAADIANETVRLRSTQQTEASDSVAAAKTQKQRSQIQRDRYASWIAAGPNEHERAQLDAIATATTARQVASAAEAVIGAAQGIQSAAGLFESVTSFGAKEALGATIAMAAAARGVAQGFVIDKDAEANLQAIAASQERRQEEWTLQRDLASQDMLIANEQTGLANDRLAIANQEYSIATIQRDQSLDMLRFLNTKFTSVEFYDWMIASLADVYSFLLRSATTVASQAEGQLAFERQQLPSKLIKQDYWSYVSESQSSSGSSTDRKGITASEQLLRDLTALDQYAFESEKRLLNLTQSFSLAALYPTEFDEFRRTGVLSFTTTTRQLDQGFPGHYMRLIKRARLSVAALIPPTHGLRATLSTTGISRVVTGDPSFPLLAVRQDPQSVALSSPISATGVFELDAQSDLLFPFEGMGVDASWTLQIPLAANPFDFDSLSDVLFTLDYTALDSPDLRSRVVKQLPRRWVGARSFSVRRDLPDVWYDLTTATDNTTGIAVALTRGDFPPNLSELAIEELAVCISAPDGKRVDFLVRPSFTGKDGGVVEGAQVTAVAGMVSSRQSGGASWHGSILADTRRTESPFQPWNFEFADAGNGADSLLDALRHGAITDILIVLTYSGILPAWNDAY